MISDSIEEKMSSLVTLLFNFEVLIKIINVNRSSKKIIEILKELNEMAALYWNENEDWIKEAKIILH